MNAFILFSAMLLASSGHALSIPHLLQRQSGYTGIDGTGAGGATNTNAGAAGGSGGSFSLSTGGLVAIIIVIVIVVIFGVATTTLFVIAKRRQWTLRNTMRHASRRLTSRGNDAAADRRSRRAGMQMQSTPATKGHTRGMVVEVRDAEKGRPNRPQPANANAGEGALKSKVTRNEK